MQGVVEKKVIAHPQPRRPHPRLPRELKLNPISFSLDNGVGVKMWMLRKLWKVRGFHWSKVASLRSLNFEDNFFEYCSWEAIKNIMLRDEDASKASLPSMARPQKPFK